MPLSAAEAYVTGLAPYLNLALQRNYQQQQLGLQGQQIGQQGQYYQGLIGQQQQQRDIQRQQLKGQAIQLLNQAAQADPLNMTGAFDQALRYAQSLGLGQQDFQAAGVQMPAGAGAGSAPAAGAPASAPAGGGIGVMGGLSDLSTALRAGVQGPDLLQHMPIPLRNEINQILSGNAAPPSLSARNPQARQLMMLASAVDPSFDATTYGARYATNKAFTSGQQGNAIRAVNQTMNHAAHLLDNINQLGNYGGVFPGAVNAVGNFVGEHVLGQTTQQNFEQTVGALASELRKVFAASGGGSLTELKSWEENFPLNASPTQQRAYLKNGMSLLEGAINALQDQYRRGFGANANVEALLSPQARRALDYITNMDPATGKPLGPQAAPGEGNAPPAAVAFLRAHPETAPAFKAKYGYLPGG